MIFVIFFIFGAIIGSFLNVVGLRFRSGISLEGRSFCVVCRKQLHWWELVPVVSFLSLKGKCSECKTPISWQYPLVELLTGCVFASVFKLEALVWSVLALLIFSIYIVILIYDLRHKIIPDSLVYASILVAFIVRVIAGGSVIDWVAGPALFVFFALIWLLSRGRALGFGDAKLALSIGLFLGGAVGLSAIVLAFWIGSVISLGILLLQKLKTPLFKVGKGLTMKSEIPFAPFLILGAWISLLFHFDFFHVLTF